MTSLALETEYTSKDAQIVVDNTFEGCGMKLSLPQEMLTRAHSKVFDDGYEYLSDKFDMHFINGVMHGYFEEENTDRSAVSLMTFPDLGLLKVWVLVDLDENSLVISGDWETAEEMFEDWIGISAVVKQLIS